MKESFAWNGVCKVSLWHIQSRRKNRKNPSFQGSSGSPKPKYLVFPLIDPSIYHHLITCGFFASFQAAEKALKALQYKVDANQKTNDHNLYQNCCDFDDHGLTQLAVQLEGLVVNSAHMRYPDTMSYPKIPNDVYTAQKAEKAMDLARDILERVKVKLT